MASVLYVDDEGAIRRAVTAWLTRKGHVVHEAATADAARVIVESSRGDLDGVFIDLWLGDRSGMELYRWIEARDPALARHTAFVTGDLVDTAALTPEYDGPVFGKPFELRDLEAQVARWAADRP